MCDACLGEGGHHWHYYNEVFILSPLPEFLWASHQICTGLRGRRADLHHTWPGTWNLKHASESRCASFLYCMDLFIYFVFVCSFITKFNMRHQPNCPNKIIKKNTCSVFGICTFYSVCHLEFCKKANWIIQAYYQLACISWLYKAGLLWSMCGHLSNHQSLRTCLMMCWLKSRLTLRFASINLNWIAQFWF